MKRACFAVGAMVLCGLLHGGCSSSSGGGVVPGLTDSQSSQGATSEAQASAAIGYLSLQAALNDNDPANFVAVQGPVVVTSPTPGTVELDFGAGTVINNTTVSGVVTSTYTVVGNTITVTVTYSNISISTAPAGVIVTTGSLTLTADISAAPTATGSITGSVTATSAQDTTTVDLNLTHTINGTAGTIVLNGSSTITSSRYGSWRADFLGVSATVSATSRQITAGTIDVVSLLIPGLSVDLTFTGPNTGTLTLTPSGVVEVFVL